MGVMQDYRFRVLIKSGNGRDHAVAVDARKIALRNNISKVNGTYKLDLEQIKVEMGEDLAMEFWEILMYMLPLEKVKRAIEEFAERVSF
ncbi:TPA_asm: hypothetical protein GahPV1_gp23 [Geoglobus ahangari pleomorphic virus 1]|nr:hypothetical protein [Geoglobus ahangari]